MQYILWLLIIIPRAQRDCHVNQLSVYEHHGDCDCMKKRVQIFRYLSSQYTRGIMINAESTRKEVNTNFLPYLFSKKWLVSGSAL